MQRDVDLVRKVLLEVERANTYGVPLMLAIEGYDQEVLYYHVKLLGEAGYLHVQAFDKPGRHECYPLSLAWAGHEFLEVAKDDARWNQAKAIVSERCGGMVVEILRSLLMDLARQSVTADKAPR